MLPYLYGVSKFVQVRAALGSACPQLSKVEIKLVSTLESWILHLPELTGVFLSFFLLLLLLVFRIDEGR